MMKYTAGGEGSDAPQALTSREMKALTLQHPNERELKNEVRWIYGWNLWTELVRQKLAIFYEESSIDVESSRCAHVRHQLSKENLLTELQSHVVTAPIQTLTKVKTIRRIKEIGVKIEVWEHVRREGVDMLSGVQIRLCEYHSGEHEAGKDKLKTLEEVKQKLLEMIVTASENIDFHNKQMELGIDVFKNFRCHGLFVDPVVSKFIDKFNRRSSQSFSLPGIRSNSNSNTPSGSKAEESVVGDSVNVNPSKMSSTRSKKSSVVVPFVPDFIEAMFTGKKLPDESVQPDRKRPEASTLPTRDSAGHFMQMIQQGIEWYLAWSQFTEKVLREIKTLAPSLGSEVVTFMTKHINHQIIFVKGLHVEVKSVAQKLKMSCIDEMSVMNTCLSLVDDFISLVESLKHESSYLIRYVEIALINLGILDLNTEPTRLQPLRLYLIRNVISMKENHLLVSIEYLYTEMANLLESVEFRFHNDRMFLEKFGPLTAELLKKYTKNRKDAIQAKEFENIQNVDEMELAREMNPNKDALGKSPLSRYQRAEDVRRWVEESKKTTLHTSEIGESAVDGACGLERLDVDPSEESWGSAKEDQENVTKAQKGPGFWKTTKSNAHSLRSDLKKRLSLKKKN